MATVSKVTLEFKALSMKIEWPATPKISQRIEVVYSPWELQHTNYQSYAFGHRSTPIIQISGPWFSRDAAEAKRTLEAIHALRTATSMYYGRRDSKKGTPPPIGRFNAHGLYNHSPVVVKNFQYDYPNEVDYVTADGPGGIVQAVPVLFEMNVELIMQVDIVDTAKNYTLDSFAAGTLLRRGYV